MHKPYYEIIDIPRPTQLGGGVWHLEGLTNIVAIFGKNGSGKSKLLRAWRDSAPKFIHYIVPERTGELDYQPGYFQQQLDSNLRKNESSRNFSQDYRRQIVGRIQAYFAARGNHRTGELPTNPADIELLLGTLLPDFAISLSGTDNPPYKITRIDGTLIGAIDDLSSGEAQVLMLGLDILTIAGIWEIQKPEARILLIDEPDAHIHPDLLVRFADFLVHISTEFKLQIVIATHSTTLLAALGQFGDKETRILYLDRLKNNFTAEPFSDTLKELAACLGGHALMGPLFGVPLLLVEGDDDYRIWSQVPRYHKVSLSALPSGGQEILQHQRALEKVLGALRDDKLPPAGFALIDGDKGKPQANRETPQMHIPFIQLNCYESENLFLTDEVLVSLGLTWDVAKVKVLSEANKFGSKKESKLKTIDSWDRQKEDVKDVVEQLSLILDSKPVHWTVRVAKAIGGNSRPEGQIAEFLGEEVINSIWGSVQEISEEANKEIVTTSSSEE